MTGTRRGFPNTFEERVSERIQPPPWTLPLKSHNTQKSFSSHSASSSHGHGVAVGSRACLTIPNGFSLSRTLVSVPRCLGRSCRRRAPRHRWLAGPYVLPGRRTCCHCIAAAPFYAGSVPREPLELVPTTRPDRIQPATY